VIGFAVALALAAILTPVARRVGLQAGFVDQPTGWKEHVDPTPHLGGTAVLAAASAGSLYTSGVRTAGVLLGVAWLFGFVGAADDVLNVDVRLRLLFEVIGAILVWSFGFGWQFSNDAWINLVATVLWVLAVVNAFNILDLMDGLASSVIIAVAGGIAALAWTQHNVATSAIALALVGASLGFLPFNVARPARIFLGDCGTMSLGLLVSALIPMAIGGAANEPPLLAPALLLFWIPLLDATYRALKRITHGVSLMTAGHDSLADRLQRKLTAPIRVALLAAGAQALCSGLGVGMIDSGVDVEVSAVPIVGSLLIVSAASLANTRAAVAAASSHK
jgi:UDP-GlcNAc:undecaprenyl-phosphate/decaprenyl-phosphate GlcNAc-1-phosphate transferase